MKHLLSKTALFSLGVYSGLCLALPLPASEATTNRMTITREYDPTRVIPISLSGFSGEVQATLQYDLQAVGFKVTGLDQAQYLAQGTVSDHVEGRLFDNISKAQLMGKAYAADRPLRAQAHALADDIVLTITGKKGIAQTKIAFKVTNGRASEIYVSDYDGYNLKQLTRFNATSSQPNQVAAPCWVPGHWEVYYTSYHLLSPNVYAQDLTTGTIRPIAHYTGLNTSPAVSPDGSRVALILSKSGSPDVWVADSNGKNLRQLTHTKEDESSPCWSPDGRTICFTSRISGGARLYTIPASGGEMKRLPVQAVNTTEPDWSPDGQSIAFTAQMGGFQIGVFDVKTQGTTFLTAGEDPSWAPNSRTLIFCHRVGEKYVLSLLDVPTKQVKNIGQISGSCSQPAWEK
jgi:TolB protein